jgi:hypothetical protein
MWDQEVKPPVATNRLAVLARAAIEGRRFQAADRAARDKACGDAVATIAEKQRPKRGQELEPYMVGAQSPSARGGARLGQETTQVEELLKARAALALRLQSQSDQRSEVEKALASEQRQHGEARETLALQQRKLREMQEERSGLLSEVSQLESKLRIQINEKEQVDLKLQKVQGTRQVMSDQASDHSERINALETENEKLRVQLQQALRERDKEVSVARDEVVEAREDTAEAFLKELWGRLNKSVPDVFIDTHIPTRKTFEQVADSYVEFLGVVSTMERHVHQVLKDLRQVGQQNDKLNHFYIVFTKNPGLLDTLRDYLTTGKRKGNYTNLLRAQQTWARAFATGLYKVIVRSPVMISEELSFKDWPIKTGFTVSEEAAVGKYFKETACKEVPEKLGTRFRKHGADMVYEDYDDLMKRK